MSSNAKTPYLNARQRVIYKSSRGAYYVKDAAGKKYYGVKARYVAVVNGTARKLTNKNTPPPAKIAPKRIAAAKERTSTRKVRSNVGKKRGPYKPRTAKVASPSSGRDPLAVKLQRYLNGNTANLSILSSNRSLASINQAAKLLKIVAANGQGWRFVKGSSAGNYRNVSEGDSPVKMNRRYILQSIHNYGQGSNKHDINMYVSNFRRPTPAYLWM